MSNIGLIVWEKEYEDMFKKTRYRIYKISKNEYYILIEECLRVEDIWNVIFKSEYFSSHAKCLKYLYNNEIGEDAYPVWFMKMQFYTKYILVMIFGLILFSIIGKFIIGGLKEFGLEDNHFMFFYFAVPITFFIWLWLVKRIGTFFKKS